MNHKIFRKYFIIASVVITVFVLAGAILSNQLIKSFLPKREIPPPVFFARIIDQIDSQDRVKSIKNLQEWSQEFPLSMMALLDENKQVIYQTIPFSIPDISVLPKNEYDYIKLKSSEEWNRNSNKPSPPSMDFLFRGPGGPPPHMMEFAIIKLKGLPANYLVVGPPIFQKKSEDKMMFLFPLFGVVSLLLSLISGIAVTLFVVYRGVRTGVREADHVIGEIKNGNLKARFQIDQNDQFGEAMRRFNFMADEIESLVNNLKDINITRTRLLQDLAHDLRTPIASLKSVTETLYIQKHKLKPEVQNELYQIAIKEIEYFERLIEDLLLLAKIQDSQHIPSKKEPLDFIDLIQQEVDLFKRQFETKNPRLKISLSIKGTHDLILADPFLMKRLLKNSLSNALQFADSKIDVEVDLNSKSGICCMVSDDGPGFSTEALESFGQRRSSRSFSTKSDGKLSVGLGSVVIKAIADLYFGKVEVFNLKKEATISGACLRWTIHPKFATRQLD